jgi:shikimate dehydrogenase
MRIYGLVGFPLAHSFSKKYFTQKFENEGITDARYELFELADIQKLPELLQANPEIKGLNVTIPYKETVIKYLDNLSQSAKEVGAVNVIKVEANGNLIGYNSDFYGFLQSLSHELSFLKGTRALEGYKALILGTGGASKAVAVALSTLKIQYRFVSRNKEQIQSLIYENIDKEILEEYPLIINTTPLGMYPNVDTCPDIPYHFLTKRNFLFDLVYNPEETLFLKKGKDQQTRTKSGAEMLYLQAEKAWEIWNA